MKEIPDIKDPEEYAAFDICDSAFVKLTDGEEFDIKMQYPMQDLRFAEANCYIREEVYDKLLKVKENLPKETTFFYQFGDKQENPYFGLISCADMIIVTGDSMSMCSECCASSVPVFIFAPADMMSEKHKRFHQSLFDAGFALPAGAPLKSIKGGFNPAEEIIHHIKNLF